MGSITRRDVIRALGLGAFGVTASGWLPALAHQSATDPNRRRQCILLWMTGGPPQTDTFDMKPNHANGGEFKEIDTSVAGLKISEHLPGLAKQADKLAILRGMSTKEGDHGRGTYLMHTGRQPMGPLRYPSIGSALSKQLAAPGSQAPDYVSIAPFTDFNQGAFGPGFLGPKYGPLTVGGGGPGAPPTSGQFAELRVDDLRATVGDRQFGSRVKLWRSMQSRFLAEHRLPAPIAHDTVYQGALQLMASDAAKAFDLSQEPETVREAYGKGRFGQGCLMARRLIEQGVAFVEVSLGNIEGAQAGWDTHLENFPAVRQLSAELDTGWSTLMTELEQRGLLETTTILWMGEFGRTPAINDSAGRDHFPAAWTAVLAGGGIRGGQAFGKTNEAGTEVVEGKTDVGDLLATLSAALGVAPDTEHISDLGRPIKIADGKPIQEVLA